MKRNLLAIAVLSAFVFTSCKKAETADTAVTEIAPSAVDEVATSTADEIVTSTATDKDGKKLEMSFNNTKDLATLHFNGETIELVSQKPASGIWYKNDQYELRGKGEQVELTKEGKTIFKN